MSASDLDHAWNAVLRHARTRLGDRSWDTWLAVLKPVSADERHIWVKAPDHAHAWISDRLLPLLSASASAVFERELRVVLRDVEQAPRGAGRPNRRGDRQEPGPATPPPADRPLSPRFRFEEFVLGPTNRFAHAAALTVAENPGVAYNPLFLCGPPGVGKTHLLHAVGRYALDHHPGIRVRYATAETFTSEFLGALRDKNPSSFKERYRGIDLLLVDDVQFLMAKKATEEEFFHTFNVLHESGAQVVLTADRVPNDLDDMEDRLRERFASGLVAEVESPDLATRLMVLRNRVTGHGVDVADPDALEEIARRVTTSVRAVEAALVRVVAFSSLTERPLTRELAREVLQSLYPDRAPAAGGAARSAAGFDDVLAAASATFGFTAAELCSKGNGRDLAWARTVAMFVAREVTGESYPVLGRRFGRNHTTVLNAVKRVHERIQRDPGAQVDLARVRERLGAGHGHAQDDGSE